MRERTCTCGEKETETLDPLGHTPGGAVREKEVAATCTTAGSYEEVVYCTVCEEELSRKTVTVDALGHTEGKPVVENATEGICTVPGSYEEVVYCTVCGEELSRKTVTGQAAGHDYHGVLTTEPLCTTEGEMTYTCTRCGDSYTEVVAPIDHAWGEPVWEWAEDYSSATATFICERGCGYQEVFTDREIASEETQHASCTQEGKFDHTASVTFNGNEYTDTVTQTTPFVHVTSEEDTYIMGNEHHWKLCTRCGEAVKEEHVFEDGAQNCSVCGVTKGSNFYFSAVSGGYSVTQNGTPSFTDTVVLPEYYETEGGDKLITEIGTQAFQSNQTFTSITLPDTIEKIGSYAFQGCTELEGITIPDSVTTIADYVFNGCLSLTKVSLPDGLTQIGAYAFGACKSLADITLPASLIKIGIYGFSGCTSLKSIEIPDTVTEIGEAAFDRCEALTSAVLPNRLQMLAEDLFAWCSKLASITIPDSVTTIGRYAFGKCTSLASITIPENVTAIGTQAFESCTQLKSVTFADADAEWTIADNEIFIPDNDDPAANAAALTTTFVSSYWSKGGTHVHTAPANADSYTMGNENHWYTCSVCGQEVREEHVFNGGQNCTLCGVTDGSNFVFTPMGNGASITQNGTPSFTDTVVLPEYYEAEDGDKLITEIGGEGFFENQSLTDIVIPDSMTTIGRYAFATCVSLTSITIPDSVTSIVEFAFYNCTKLASVKLPENPQFTTISNNSFAKCAALTSITIPASVTSIGEYAFSECGFKSITLPTNLTAIGGAAFFECASLTKITLPANLTTIGGIAFRYCRSLTSITIPANVTSIGENAFGDCSSLTSVIFEDVGYEWKISNGSIFVTSDDPAANATALKDTYTNYIWTRGNAHTHTAGEEWVTDGDKHWKECSVCNAKLEEAAHKFSSDEYVMGNEHHWKVCSVCGPVKEAHVFNGAQNCTLCGVTDGQYFSFTEVPGVASVVQNGTPNFTATVVLPEYYEAEDGDQLIMNIGQGAFSGNGSLTDIVIPDSYTMIDNDAFGASGLKTIVIPDSVMRIGMATFDMCFKLTSVTLPSTLTEIEDVVFAARETLPSITLPDGITTIGAEAFSGCSSLQEFDAPKNLTSIGEKAFYGCTSLTLADFYWSSLTALSTSLFEGCTALDDFIPSETLKSIGQRAFYGCTAFTTISIPRSTTYIGAYAFYNCNNLTHLSFDDDSDDAYWVNTNGDTFLVSDEPASRFALYFWAREDYYGYDWTKGESHEHVAGTEIYNDETTHWQKCTVCGLVINEDVHTSPTSPEDYTKGSRNHWYYCTVCNYMTTREEHDYMFAVDNQCMVCNVTDPDHLLTFDYYDGRVLDNGAVTTVSTLVLPDYIERYYDVEPTLIPITSVNFGRAENNAVTTVTKIVLGKFVTVIEDYAFQNLKKLEYVDIPDGVTYIGDWAFQNCAITSVTIPDGVTYIGDWAFQNCAITSVTIPESVTDIGEYAFYGCENLTSANIPESVTSIPDCMFDGCESLTSIELHDKITSIGRGAFTMTALTSIHIPESVTYIGDSAFEYCHDLTSVNIPDGVTEIQGSTFGSCSSLTSIELHDNITSIGDRAFASTALAEITLPKELKAIDGYAFEFTELQSITLPEKLETIGDRAFAFTHISTVTIPESVTHIGMGAFYGTSLTSIIMTGLWYNDNGNRLEMQYMDPEHVATMYFNVEDYDVQEIFGAYDKITDYPY